MRGQGMGPVVITLRSDAPNLTGEKGPRCRDCSGYGEAAHMGTGRSGRCQRCEGTGVEPPDPRELLRRLEALEARVGELEKKELAQS
jgi:hypothetical protein